MRASKSPAAAPITNGTVTIEYNGHSLAIELEAGIDLETGMVFATFQTLDPATTLPPDILLGFLPPENGSGRGMGHFLFSVKPVAGLPSGTEIRNVALISFDRQTLIATNQVDALNPAAGTDPTREALNIIDNTAPSVSLPPVFTYDVKPGRLSFTLNEGVHSMPIGSNCAIRRRGSSSQRHN